MNGFTQSWLDDYQARHARQPVGVVVLVAADRQQSSAGELVNIRLELPLPPTVNQLYANVPGKGRVRTAKYRAWRKKVISLAGYRGPRIEGDFHARVDIFQNRGGDLDGRLKAIFDICKTIGAIRDDKGLVSMLVRLHKGSPMAFITLTSHVP